MKTKSLVLKSFLLSVSVVLFTACGSGQPPIQGTNVYGQNGQQTCYNQYGQAYACTNGVQTNNPYSQPYAQQVPLVVQSQIQWISGDSFRFELGQVNAGDKITLYSQNGIYLYKQCVPTGGFSFSWNWGSSPYTPVMGAQLKVNGQLLNSVYGPATVQTAGTLTLEGTAAGVSHSCDGSNLQSYYTAISGMGTAIGVLQR